MQNKLMEISFPNASITACWERSTYICWIWFRGLLIVEFGINLLAMGWKCDFVKWCRILRGLLLIMPITLGSPLTRLDSLLQHGSIGQMSSNLLAYSRIILVYLTKFLRDCPNNCERSWTRSAKGFQFSSGLSTPW
jgi:hypothetical protein